MNGPLQREPEHPPAPFVIAPALSTPEYLDSLPPFASLETGKDIRSPEEIMGRLATLEPVQGLCRLLGIRHPILQAGMGHVAHGELAAAVSEAGGLGVIGAGPMTPDDLRRQICLVRERTSQPFGVDILFARTDQASGSGYTSQVDDQIGVVLEERVPVLISGLGNPLGVVQQAHDQGMVVMSLVGNVRQARRLAAAGVDAIIASGCDGGGHVGTVGTAALVPQVVDAVSVPAVAGGGLSDGRSLVAALAWGACGIWLGTRFIATQEARAHHNYKDKLVAIDEEGTIVTRAHSGKPVRMVRNTFTATWAGREAEIKPYPWQLLEVGLPASIAGRIEGDVEHGVLPAGQGAGLIADVPSAGEVVARIVQQAESLLARLSGAAGA